MFTAVLDSCVLWPSLLRDFLLSLAIEGCYQARWSSAILAEVERNEARKLIGRGAAPGDAAERSLRLIAQMRRAFPESEVTGWQRFEGSFGLPDADDEHVLAAAVAGGAGVIVTENLRDFPALRIVEGIEVMTPAEFVFDVVEGDAAAAARAIREIARRSGTNGRPQRTAADVVDTLARRYGLEDALDLLRVG